MNFKDKQEDLRAEIKLTEPGRKALKLITRLREDYDWAIPGYRNSISILSDNAYQDRRHFLLELIQNADDAQFAEGHDAELRVIIDNESVELCYNEAGFTTEDVLAITDIGASTKVGRDIASHKFIGEKGIGFKSVFALAQNVEIESPPWHFILQKDESIIPRPLRDGKLRKGDGTRLRVTFGDAEITNVVASELIRFVSKQTESFLFLQRLCKFAVIDNRGQTAHRYELEISPHDRVGSTLTLLALPKEEIKEYITYSQEVEFPADLVKQRWERLDRSGPIKRRLTAAALADSVTPAGRQGRLFCYLPTEVTIPVPIFLQVDGHTTADRGKLHDPEQNGWNRHLFATLPDFLAKAVLNWRDNPIVSQRLPDYVPDDPGTDQLKPVFVQTIERLKTEPWVKTFDGCPEPWVSPKWAIIAPNFWMEMLGHYPEYRAQAEAHLGKRFVNPTWAANGSWESKWQHFGIARMKDEQIVGMVEALGLPDLVKRQRSELTNVYRNLLHLDALNNRWFWHASRIISSLRRASIFPMEDGRFEAIGDENDSKVFWVSVRSKRATGLEGAVNLRMINPEYTYKADAGASSKDEDKELDRQTQVLRDLLTKLEVEEFNDDNLLTALQIPMLKDSNAQMALKYQVLSAVFEAYRAKRNPNETYLQALRSIAEASFLDADGKERPLREMLLPSALRVGDADNVYVKAGMKTLHLSDAFQLTGDDNIQISTRHERWARLREFLTCCGIFRGPRFDVLEGSHSKVADFSSSDPYRYEIWRKRVEHDYTSGNPVKVITVQLDEATRRLCERQSHGHQGLPKRLYEAWKSEFAECLENSGSEQCAAVPPPGWFHTRYRRHDERCLSFRDTRWAGIQRSSVPLETTSGVALPADECFKVSGRQVSDLTIAGSVLPLVRESQEDEVGYHTFYLGSLEVKALTMQDVNALWERVGDSDGSLILQAAYELIKTGVLPPVGLQLYDKAKKCLRPAAEFHLGHFGVTDVPLIEEQYGQMGSRLGELLNLPSAKMQTAYHELFSRMMDGAEEVDYGPELNVMLTRWATVGPEERQRTRNDFRTVFQLDQNRHPPILVLDSQQLYDSLNREGVQAYAVQTAGQYYAVTRAAADCGFAIPQVDGELTTSGPRGLSQPEQTRFHAMLSAYEVDLEPRERERLRLSLVAFGELGTVPSRIVRVEQAKRQVTSNVAIDVALPHFNLPRQEIVFSLTSNLDEMLAHFLCAAELTTLKAAKRDVAEISRKLGKEDARRAGPVHITKLEEDTVVVEPADVVQQLGQALRDDRLAQQSPAVQEWRSSGLSPDEEESLRNRVGDEVVRALTFSPQELDRLEDDAEKRSRVSRKRTSDHDRINIREFLLDEYDGRCQVCGTQLLLSSGGKWIEIFHAVELREGAPWANRPWNVLGLCPNCHAMAKHGGERDLSGIFLLAQDALAGNAFPIEVEEFNGDYYTVDVKINGSSRRLVLSFRHLSYVMAIYGIGRMVTN